MENTLKPFTPYQKFIIAVVALIQFSVVLDFMVMSPLGPMLMTALQISPKQFGIVVAAYAFSAGISGILSAGVADKYDRKKFLLFFYTGFVVGTLFCALAPTYELLLAARIITGLFGGVIGAISMAIVTDLFEINQRGRVMGFSAIGFSASQVLGIPLSLWLAHRYGWNSPFVFIVAYAAVLGVLIAFMMKPVTGHLALQKGESSKPIGHLLSTLAKKRYQTGYLTTALLSLGGFMMMPFGTAFAVNNMGVDSEHLWYIFGITGITSMIAFPLVGRLCDRFNKMTIYIIGSIWAIVMVIVHSHWGLIPEWLVILSNIMMFLGIMGRMVPSNILISAVPEMKDRGAFMSINSSLQQMAGGVASIVAGLIVIQPTPTSALVHFDYVGYVVAVFIVVSIYLMQRVNNIVKPKPNAPAETIEKPALASE